MQQVVTLTGVELKTGNGANGPWTLFVFKDAGGNKYQTFDGALGNLGQQLMNQQVTVTYEIEQRQYTDRNGQVRTANNNVLGAIVPGAQAGVPVAQPAPQPQAQTPVQQAVQAAGAACDRAAALQAALKAIHAGVITGVNDPHVAIAVADTVFLPYIQNGAVSSHGTGGDPGPDVDTAADQGPQY